MTDRAKQLERLVTLTKLKEATARSELSILQKRNQELIEALRRLNLDLKTRADARSGSADVALIAGADTRWQNWVEQRRTLINTEMAACRIQIDKAEGALRIALGQCDAAQVMQGRHAIERARKLQRRADYES